MATMIKVLAAELSDQGRLSRGKRYWSDGAVTDIVIGHGAVTAEIQGSRAEPYVVTLEASSGSGVPSRRELWVQCTCPDDAGTGAAACKHAVAALFALSDEVAIEPELVERWRSSRQAGPMHERASVSELPARDPAAAVERSRAADVIPLHPDRTDAPSEVRPPEWEGLALLLRAPTGITAPELPDPLPIEHVGIRDRLLADVLADAVDHLAIRWE
jgi:uncharacterized Zn finger protein